MNYKLYLVGGFVRDKYLGLKSKDIDYSVVIDSAERDLTKIFDGFERQLVSEGYEVFLSTPECFTIRAKFPKDHELSGVADFVIARRELYYPEDSRRPVSRLGTLEDDLSRRDFTVNAMAIDPLTNKLIDPFNGYTDLRLQSLDTPLEPHISFYSDPLRILRAVRFCITKDLVMCRDVKNAIREISIHRLGLVSEERIREELYKCFKFDTKKTLKYLNLLQEDLNFPIFDYVFDNTGLWLEPTNKK